MTEFFFGVLSSIFATMLIWIVSKWVLPTFKDRYLYSGIRVNGSWAISELRNGKSVKSGTIEFTQQGRTIKGVSTRTKTRDGKKSTRKFNYRGFISGRQITLIFEDAKGEGFDTGTYVFTIQNNAKEMIGMTTFHGKAENKIVSEERLLTKIPS